MLLLLRMRIGEMSQAGPLAEPPPVIASAFDTGGEVPHLLAKRVLVFSVCSAVSRGAFTCVTAFATAVL